MDLGKVRCIGSSKWPCAHVHNSDEMPVENLLKKQAGRGYYASMANTTIQVESFYNVISGTNRSLRYRDVHITVNVP